MLVNRAILMHKTKIFVHLVFVTKYRKKILNGDIKQIVYDSIADQCNSMGIEIIAIRIDNGDHIHLMLRLKPTQSVSLVVQLLKEKSRYATWQSHPELRQYYWYKDLLWSRGYFCSTTGEASSEIVEKYINSQG